MNEHAREVLDQIMEKISAFKVPELNALVAANFAEWRKYGGPLSEWNPAGNPAHAHDLIDKLMEDGLYVNLFGRPDDWTCEIMDKNAVVYAEVSAATMARAICEAALVTVLTKYGEMLKV